MLWVVSERKVRSYLHLTQNTSDSAWMHWGTTFASFATSSFDLNPLLTRAIVREGDDQEDHEGKDHWNNIDEDPRPHPHDLDDDATAA